MAIADVNNKILPIYSIRIRDDSENSNYQGRRQSSNVKEIRKKIKGSLKREVTLRDSDIYIESDIDPKFVNAYVAGIDDRYSTLKNFRELGNESSEYQNDKPQSTNSKQIWKCRIFQRKWLVLLAGFVNLMISIGFVINMSTLYVAFSEEFGRSKAETALIQSVCLGFIFFGGFISGGLVSIFGTRTCGMVGGLIAALGMFTSYFATSVPFLIGTTGVLGGIGFSINYICGSTTVGNYFHGRERLLALVFVNFGAGVSTMVFPHLLHYLIEEYGWRGCMMIISGIVSHLCLCGAISKSPHTKNNTDLSGHTDDGTTVFLNKPKDFLTIVQEIKTCLCNKKYMTFIFSFGMSLAILNSVLVFFIDYFEFTGFEEEMAVWFYFAMGSCNAIFRLVPGIIAQIRQLPKTSIPGIFIAVAGVSMLVLPTVTTISGTFMTVCVYGIGMGGTISSGNLTIFDLVGNNAFSSALGFAMTAYGIFNVCIPPLFGYIRDISGSYTLAFYIGGCSAFASSTILMFIPFFCGKGKVETDTYDVGNDIKQRCTSHRKNILPWKASVDLAVFDDRVKCANNVISAYAKI